MSSFSGRPKSIFSKLFLTFGLLFMMIFSVLSISSAAQPAAECSTTPVDVPTAVQLNAFQNTPPTTWLLVGSLFVLLIALTWFAKRFSQRILLVMVGMMVAGMIFASAKTSMAQTAVGDHCVCHDPSVMTVTPKVDAPAVANPSINHELCRPDGLYKTPSVNVPYCTVYDTAGREVMASSRRVIGYFASWRTGKNGQPAFLASDIPWGKITHINYAFGHVDVANDYKVSAGDEFPGNAATQMEWPEYGLSKADGTMDSSLPYTGHFNAINTKKKQYPNVKTLISIGGWAETGGHFGADGTRIADGGFYKVTTNTDGSVNTAGINAFADSAIVFMKKYNFDGLDIDYEYATSMPQAGNPLDFTFSDSQRANLVPNAVTLFKVLREKLDAASAADGKHYMLTIASASSGYLLRGVETYQMNKYFDFVNMMSYDLHGSWNKFVGHNAALYDTGKDGEIAAWGMYDTANDETKYYNGYGYLNTDWAYHYFRGSLPAGRINIGLPYYTRGWQNVTGGTDGLWGTSSAPDQNACPPGTGLTDDIRSQCGNGAIGIDNIWHDLNDYGEEIGSGANPMWHAKNLENGIVGSYLASYGVTDTALTGEYARKYDSGAVAPWLWNADKKVFLSTEDEESITTKVQYVIDKGIGGIMFWEMSGDYSEPSASLPGSCATEYRMGSTLTKLGYDMLATAAPYGNVLSNQPMPAQSIDVTVEFVSFPVGDDNYPISPKIKITNNSGMNIPANTKLTFDIPTAVPSFYIGTIPPWETTGNNIKILTKGHAGPGNVGGLKGDFHRLELTIPAAIANGSSGEVPIIYFLPMSGPSNYIMNLNGTDYSLKFENRRDSTIPTPTPTPGPTATPSPTPTMGPSPTPLPPSTSKVCHDPSVMTVPPIVTPPGTSVANQDSCRPEGLYKTPGVNVPYCTVYDTNGREVMASSRRVIGYFASWRTGKNGQPPFLVSDIPWGKITHINYAFGHTDVANNYKVSAGDEFAGNSATDMEWPEYGISKADGTMDSSLPYTGHFNLLNTYKKKYPNVKTLISIGGWAETGGHFGADGSRVADGGFYKMTTNADGSTNTAGINAFADSAIAFMKKYNFDGLDIDYEYATSMPQAGNPLDFTFSDPQRTYLVKNYEAFLKTLREKLDAQSATDGKHYMLTIASASSGYLLRGVETYQMARYLDYVNLMSYDLHGSWNAFVGHNAALYDTGTDSELAAWEVYSTVEYANIGYLNTDWAYHYFRGALQAGRINIGLPYYTRGWQNVTGGNNGLWGLAPYTDQTKCPAGTHLTDDVRSECGYGAMGIDNIWHDLDTYGSEIGSGASPMWHAKNLEAGILGSYLEDYGLDPVNEPADQLVGDYVRNYDAVAVAPWLWNAQKKVFLSTEDEESIETKVQYVIDKGIGGIMFWEMSGDYSNPSMFASDPNSKCDDEHFMGSTLTKLGYDMLDNATPYGNTNKPAGLPTQTMDMSVSFSGFKDGDANYPIEINIDIKNNTSTAVPGGGTLEFDVPTSAPNTFKSWNGLTVSSTAGHTGSNVGGLKGDFHRVKITIPAWDSIPANGTYQLKSFIYYLPITGPANFVLTTGGTKYLLVSGGGSGGTSPTPVPGSTATPTSGGGSGTSCASIGQSTSGLVTYPTWPDGDHANGGSMLIYNGAVWKAAWWTNAMPGTTNEWLAHGETTGSNKSYCSIP
jgi:GH18 family chitinase